MLFMVGTNAFLWAELPNTLIVLLANNIFVLFPPHSLQLFPSHFPFTFTNLHNFSYLQGVYYCLGSCKVWLPRGEACQTNGEADTQGIILCIDFHKYCGITGHKLEIHLEFDIVKLSIFFSSFFPLVFFTQKIRECLKTHVFKASQI